uniref:Regulatory protein zeste n=1 Tax=Phlebotomus papatasi TaxID=29031 RepID=A0A1B0D5C8_PHLPP
MVVADFTLLTTHQFGLENSNRQWMAWKSVSDTLNKMWPKSARTPTEWKRTWISVKNKLVDKYRKLQSGNERTIALPSFSGAEMKVLALLGVEGTEKYLDYEISDTPSTDDQTEAMDLHSQNLQIVNTQSLRRENNGNPPEVPPTLPPIKPSVQKSPQSTDTSGDPLRLSPFSLQSQSSFDSDQETLPANSPQQQQLSHHPCEVLPPEPYTLREMQFHYLLKSSKVENQRLREDVQRLTEERDFFKNQFVKMRKVVEQFGNYVSRMQ